MIEQTIELWKNLIRLHGDLLVIAVKEYQALIIQDIEEIEKITSDKEEILRQIILVDDYRVNLINNLKAKNTQDLVELWKNDVRSGDLIKYNQQLKDVISKIKEQNVKNQLFYHKLMKSLSLLKKEFKKGGNYQVYDKRGLTTE